MKKYFETTLRLWKLLKPFHGYFYFQLLIIALSQGLGIFMTFIVSKIIDNAVIKDWRIVIIFCFTYLFSLILMRISSYIQNVRTLKTSNSRIQQYLQEYSLKKILNLNTSQYIEEHSAIRLQVIDRGENSLQSIIETLFLTAIPTITLLIFSLITIFFYSINIALLSIITFSVILFSTVKFTNYWRPLQRKNIDQWDSQRRIRVEAFEHLKLIKILGMEIYYIKKYISNRLTIVEYMIKIWMQSHNFRFARDFIISISRWLSLVLAIYMFSQDKITIGIVYAIFSWITNMYSQFDNINQVLRQLPTNFIYLEKYLDVIDMKPEFEEEGENKFKAGDIEFKNINFKYPKGEKNVLHDLSFKIKSGSKVAFVGYSGSGKTTIVQLLLRAYDYKEGEIKIDGINLKDMSANSLRENIGYVEQHVDLFDDTIKENILFGVKDLNKLKNKSGHIRSKHINKIEEKENKITEEEIKNKIEEVAKKARIDQFYHRLGDKKFETMIGERGIKLSGGERQRVGIARALIKDPAILIFDEATSALDAENEKFIKEAIEEASIGRTTIIIAHRLSTVRDVDEIFMMSHGKILASGNHQNLLKTCKEYRELVEEQMK